MLGVSWGYDPADPYSREPPFAHLRRGALSPAARIAIADVGPLCAGPVAETYLRLCETPNARTVDIAPFLEIARLLYEGPWVAERTAALRDFIERDPEAIHPATRTILESGFGRLAVDAFDAFHLLARTRRRAAELFAEHDALLLPTAPFCPTLAEIDADPLGPNRRLGTFTNFVNLCDLAAIAVPAGRGSDGLPVGVTLIGPAWSEGRLAPLADAIHRACASTVGRTAAMLPRAAAPDPVQRGETSLFCIGAPMSGLPLNHQVTALGGRLLREARTAPCYRLHAIGARPGMVRVAEGGGAVLGEVWAVPAAAIGALLAQVPPPLGFATVELHDGPCLGFIAETAGVADAPDITHFGGWRAWLAAR
jgi:allophanate hydrolase